MTDVNLTTEQLAERWHMATQTLDNWRSLGKGPKYIKLGDGRTSIVVYRLTDIEDWEKEHEVTP